MVARFKLRSGASNNRLFEGKEAVASSAGQTGRPEKVKPKGVPDQKGAKPVIRLEANSEEKAAGKIVKPAKAQKKPVSKPAIEPSEAGAKKEAAVAADASLAETDKSLPVKGPSVVHGGHDKENSPAEQKTVSGSEFGKY